MGMGKWFDAVKKLFSCAASENKANKKSKSIKSRAFDRGPSNSADVRSSDVTVTLTPPPAPTPSLPTHEEVMEGRVVEIGGEQDKHAYSVALASAVAAEAAAIAARAAAEAARLAAITTTARVPGKSKEEASAVRIQTAFRGYLARRALRALRGLARLKNLADGSTVERRTTDALHSMQTFTRLQTQIRARRVRMLEQNQALQRQLQLKPERELEKSKTGEDWNDSTQSKEQIETSLLYRQEAAIRRERALAYAFTHQWRNSSRAVIPTFTDPNNPRWGWCWMERWMITRPWQSRSAIDKDTMDHAKRDTISGRIQSMPQKSSRPPSRQSPSTPAAKAPPTTRKTKERSESPKAGHANHKEEDQRSIGRLHSERPARRRHSIASSILDAASNASMPDSPSYMQLTESTRAKSCAHCLSGDRKFETLEKGAAGLARRRLSFPVADKPGMQSPVKTRRHPGPPISEG